MIFENSIRIFQTEKAPELYLVLNPLVPSFIVTNINGVLLLKCYNENKTFEEIALLYKQETGSEIEIKTIINYLEKIKDKKLFEKTSMMTFHKPFFLNAVYLNMTSKCNLKCIYCYAEERTESNEPLLTFDDYKRVIDEIPNITSERVTFCFTGGEPLLNPLTVKVAKYTQSLGYQNHLLTNGTLINERNIDFIIPLFKLIRISMDGSTSEKHNFYRGPNAYERSTRAIELLKEKNANYTIAMVVTKKNIQDVPEMNNKWGQHLTFQPIFPLGPVTKDSDLYLTGNEYFDALSLNPDIVPFSNLNDIIERQINNRSLYKCSMGDGELSISCTGDVYPCQLMHRNEYIIGNIHKKSLKEIYNSPENERFKYHTIDKIKGCENCDFRLLCGGACQARHLSETGTIDLAGDFCEYEKRGIIEGLILSSKDNLVM